MYCAHHGSVHRVSRSCLCRYGDKTDAELRQSWFGLLHPNTTLRQLYDGVQMSILLYFLYILPYRIGFSITPSAGAAVLDVVIDFLLAVDIFVMFHSCVECSPCLFVARGARCAKHNILARSSRGIAVQCCALAALMPLIRQCSAARAVLY